jgi:hypothetical protein
MRQYPSVPGIEFRPIPGFENYALGSNGSLWHWHRSWSKCKLTAYRDGQLVCFLTSTHRGWNPTLPELMQHVFGETTGA